MNTIHFYDNREQIIYEFLLAWFPSMTEKQLPCGDYLTERIEYLSEPYDNTKRVLPRLADGITLYPTLVGHIVENKRKDFDIQSSANLSQFQKELCQMAVFRKDYPYLQMHAAWYKPGIWNNPYKVKQDGTMINEIRVFTEMCEDYHVRSHVFDSEEELKAFFKKLEQPSAYTEFEPFIVRHNDTPSLIAQFWRLFDGVSGPVAVELAKIPELSTIANLYEAPLSFEAECALDRFLGDIADNEPTALFKKIKKQLEARNP